jgi:hypothetical protein
VSAREARERAYHAMVTLDMLVNVFTHLQRERASDDHTFEAWCDQMVRRCVNERGRRFDIWDRALSEREKLHVGDRGGGEGGGREGEGRSGGEGRGQDAGEEGAREESGGGEGSDEMSAREVKIWTEGTIGVVSVDGKPIGAVRAYTLRHEARRLPQLTLQLVPPSLSFEGQAVVHVPTHRVLEEIGLERDRQCAVEGYTTEHDDAHREGQLARAAGCYALSAGHQLNGDRPLSINAAIDLGFAWGRSHWKPKDVRRDLIRAAALIVAEIERLDRVDAAKGEGE